ncbi:MAG: Do family serine endopeptidase [Planctomycetota bacterium]|jgi:serine protease Do|nr:Do family serine endopeptidase [Planctomycetota bacterium]
MRTNLRCRTVALTRPRGVFGAKRVAIGIAAVVFALAITMAAGSAHAAESENLRIAKALSNAYAEVVERMLPAVVGIETEKVNRSPRTDFEAEIPFGNELFEEFFKRFQPEIDRFRGPRAPREMPRIRGIGSGVIIDAEGHILTNYHVIADTDVIKIEIANLKGRTFEADIVGSDPNSDLAVLRMKDPPENLIFAALGDSDQMNPGNIVLAIGSPRGFKDSVTTGVVSAKGRTLGEVAYESFIQTDAAINPGNSGGPLVNLDGEVIGLNTMIATRTGGSDGIGFAIPINQAKSVIAQLIEKGSVTRGWLGIVMNPEEPEISIAMGHDGTGVVVTDVDPDGPAAKAGLRKGDLVISFDNVAIKDNEHLRYMVAETPPGRGVPMVVLRDNERVTLTVNILPQPEDLFTRGRPATSGQGESREDRETNEAASRLGIAVRNIDSQTRQLYGIEGDIISGVVITKIDPDGPAASKGLEPGVVIIEMNRRPVIDVASFRKILQENGDKEKMLVFVKRGAVARYMMLDLKK